MDLQFKNITALSMPEMAPFYAMRPNRTCDSVFLESFIWKDFYHVQYAIWENKALLWLMESGGRYFSAMPLCRPEDLSDAFQAIEQYFNENLGFPLVINLADEYAVQHLNLPPERYRVEEQTDSSDYLYLGDSLRTLSGRKLHKKKNRVNSFMRQYEGRCEYRKMNCQDSHYVWKFLDQWQQQKGDETEAHLEYEIQGIHDILKHCLGLNVRMGGVFIDGQMEAFSIGSYNPVEDMAVIHIEKANPEISGLYQYINQKFLLEEFPDVQWVNREDDLGLEGLRKAKMSYYPADFARKYLVEQILNGQTEGYRWAREIKNTSAGETVAFLPDDQKADSLQLWKNCFPEDSQAFVDYYYTEKTKDNRILVKKQNGLLTSMLHLNPYSIRLKDRDCLSDYIVGVATEAEVRHQGHMADLLKNALCQLSKEQVPFAFLMPASPDIYLPFDFAFIEDLPAWQLTETAGSQLTRQACSFSQSDCQKAADFMEQWLASRYELYCHRDPAYVRRLLTELASEQGTLEFLYDRERLVGLEAFWGLDKREQRLLYADDAYAAPVSEKPLMMGRITCLPAFLSGFRLEEGAHPLKLRLEITDSVIEENQGTFVWSLTSDGSDLEQLCACGQKDPENLRLPLLSCKIDQLLQWLTSYREARQLWPQASEEIFSLLDRIQRIHGVFLDEIV